MFIFAQWNSVYFTQTLHFDHGSYTDNVLHVEKMIKMQMGHELKEKPVGDFELDSVIHHHHHHHHQNWVNILWKSDGPFLQTCRMDAVLEAHYGSVCNEDTFSLFKMCKCHIVTHLYILQPCFWLVFCHNRPTRLDCSKMNGKIHIYLALNSLNHIQIEEETE